jgi:hypothetical protein
VQNKIKNWIQWKDNIDSPIMWLYGGAGAGKSTIARTISEWCHEERLLLSSFFFWRSDPTRNHIKTFLATLVYSITQCIPEMRQRVVELAVEEDRHIFSRNLESQFIDLVYGPLVSQTLAPPHQLQVPYIMNVDGLGECLNQDEQGSRRRFSLYQWEQRIEAEIATLAIESPYLSPTRVTLNGAS